MHTKRDNYSGGCAGLATGTTTTISVANAFAFAIAGRAYQKAAALNFAPALRTGATAFVALAASQSTVFYVWIDIAGAVTLTQGKVGTSATASGYQAGAFEWPQDDSAYACIGAIKVTTNASGVFTVGTTAFGAANTTVTYYNVMDDYGVAIPY